MIGRARGLAIARVVGALVVGAMAWPFVAPAYDRGVTAAAIAVLQQRPSTADVRARHEGEWTIIETADLAPQRLPRLVSSYPGGVRVLQGDEQLVAERVRVEAGRDG